MSVIPSRVFVSYSSADDTLARRVVTALDSVGVVSWFAPRDIVPTRTYAGQITTAIEESEILLALITDASATNQNVLREVDLAYRNNKTLLPFIVTAGGIGPDLDYYFGPLHHIISTPDQVAEDVGRHFSQPAIVELHARESDDIPDVEVGATVSTSPTSTPTPTLDDVDTKWSQGELHMRGGDPRLAAADFREALSLLSRVDGDTTRQQATIRGLLIAALKEQLAEAEPDLQAAPTLPILRELSALLGDHYGESAGSALGARVALAEALDEAGEATESHEILLQVTSTDATVSAALSNDLLRAHYHLAVHAVRGRDFSSALQAFSALRPVMTVRHPLRPLLDGLDHWEQRARTEAGVLTVPFGHRMEDIFNEWKTLPPSGEVVESLEYPDIDSVWDTDERHLDPEACLPVVKTSASSATPSGREITSTFHVVGSNTDTTSGVPGKPRLMFRQATRMVWRFRLDQLTAALPGESRAARLDLYLHRRVPSTTFATFSAVVSPGDSRGSADRWAKIDRSAS